MSKKPKLPQLSLLNDTFEIKGGVIYFAKRRRESFSSTRKFTAWNNQQAGKKAGGKIGTVIINNERFQCEDIIAKIKSGVEDSPMIDVHQLWIEACPHGVPAIAGI